MERLEPRATVAVPISALVLAVAAAASFAIGDAIGILSDAAEDVSVLTWLVGSVLLSWAAIIGVMYAVLLGARLFSRRPVSPAQVALVVSALALIAVALAANPLWGTGSAVG